MKKVFKILVVLVLVVVLVIGGALAYIKIALPDVGAPPDLKVEQTPERVERGKYLANAVTLCMDCHSTRDWTKFSGPIAPGTIGVGGERFDHSIDFPGIFYSKNITPTGISRYTDGELFRVITAGVNKEGKAMFPVMPYLNYGRMDEEDIYSIIAYLRTLDPVESAVPESVPDFPMSLIMNTIPVKGAPEKRPDISDKVAYGKYMVNASACIECHTQVDKGQIIPALSFAGGREFKFPNGSVVRSSNISPDDETGIGRWTEEMFIQRFKMFTDSTYTLPEIRESEFNTIMPWSMYANMKEEDLSAIYVYLRTVTPLKNNVVKFTPGKDVVMIKN